VASQPRLRSMNEALPEELADALIALSQGDLSYRLKRTMDRSEADTRAFFFNAIADELERIVNEARKREGRLIEMSEQLSEALIRVAEGDFTAQVARDGKGDAIDVLVFLVNNTIAEIGALVQDREKRLEREQRILNQVIEERTSLFEESIENFRLLFEASPVALVISRWSDGKIVDINKKAGEIFGSKRDGKSYWYRDFWVNDGDRARLLDALANEGQLEDFEAQLRRQNGEAFWCSISAQLVHFAGERHVLVGARDISEQKALEARLLEMATTDPLTGALNRRKIFEVVNENIDRARRYARPFSIAMLDLDHFKAVNDSYGHGFGDIVLRSVVEEVRRNLRATDFLGRYGGEEVLLVFPETGLEDALHVAERIRGAIAECQFRAGDACVNMSLSGGVAALLEDEPLDDLLKRADNALYLAKAGGRNRIVVG